MCLKGEEKKEERNLPSPTKNRSAAIAIKHRVTLKFARKIKRNREISAVLQSGKQWHCPPITVVYLNNRLCYNRCAVIVPKIAGSAVERNRIKRAVRENFRASIIKTAPHRDILIKICPQRNQTISNQAIEGALKQWSTTVTE